MMKAYSRARERAHEAEELRLLMAEEAEAAAAEAAAQERHEAAAALWRGRCERAYAWSLRARQAQHEAWRAWRRALQRAHMNPPEIRWETLCRTAEWCLRHQAMAERLEAEAAAAAEAWYEEAVRELD